MSSHKGTGIVSLILSALLFLVGGVTVSFAQSFGTPLSYPVGSLPYGVALGDFNGDGMVDLASANNLTKNISVLLGNGVASFSPKTDYDVGAGPYGIVTTDLNNDGKLDLVTSNSFSLTANVSVLLGNGNGTFQNKVDYGFTGAAQADSIATADFNNDGKSDIVVANGGGASVFIGNGDGTLNPPVHYGSPNFATDIAVGDFNNDSKLDLGVSSYTFSSTGAITVMLGVGDGTFSAGVNYATAPSPFSLVAADFNGDSKLDFATANVQVSNVSILLGNGDGTFQSPANYPAGFNPYGLSTGDFDLDGKRDLLVAQNGGGFHVLKGNGDGSFGSSATFQAGGFFGYVIDLNSDSKPDVVTVGSGSFVAVLLNQTGPYGISGTIRDTNGALMSGVSVSLTGGTSRFLTTDATGTYSFSDLTSGGNFTVTPLKQNYVFAPINFTANNISSSLASDFTGTLQHYSITGIVQDAFGNVMPGVTVTLSGSQSGVATTGSDGRVVFPGLPGGGNYTLIPSFPKFTFSPPGSNINNLSSNRSALFVGRPATFTISGKVNDTVTGANIDNVTLLLSGTRYATAVTNSSGYSFSNLPIDGDYTVTAYSSVGSALFTSVRLSSPLSQSVSGLNANTTLNFNGRRLNFSVGGTTATGVDQGDLNGDGKTDVVVATATGPNIHVLLGNGDGTFQAPVTYAADSGPLDVAVSDFNGDGKLDVATTNNGSFGVSILLGNGDGTLQARVNYTLGNFNPGSRLSVSDLNGDNKKDLAVLGQGNLLFVLLGNGDGTFQTSLSRSVPTGISSISAGDFNGDNKPDLVIPGFPNSLLVLFGNGNGTFADPVQLAAVSNVRHLTVADFNADGKLDVAVTGDTSYIVFRGNGDGTFQPGAAATVTDNVEVISGDFDGDMKLDLAIANYTGGVSFASGNGDGTFKPAVIYQAGQFQGGLVGGDFNNDASLDLAVTSQSGDQVVVLLNTSATRPPALQFSSSTYVGSEGSGNIVVTVTRTHATSTARVNYATIDNSGSSNCSVNNTSASSRCDYETTVGTLLFAVGETSKTISIPLVDDAYAEQTQRLFMTLSNEFGANLGQTSTAIIDITDNDAVNGPNPVDDAQFFVRQHYLDFLNREPDPSGLAFWSNQITECLQPGATCDPVARRINVSAAFFLSIEFQETGYLVYRMYKASYGDLTNAPVPLRLAEFLPDTQQIGKGVVIGQPGADQLLEDNKVVFGQEFVSRDRFIASYPTSLTPTAFVDKLYSRAGVASPPVAERTAAINEFGGAGNTANNSARARALRRVAENSTLIDQEKNKAFVLTQYFGYLRRNPNDAPEPGLNFDGYNFWLGKLNQFNGNFVEAEMVKSFIISGEYRQRFGM